MPQDPCSSFFQSCLDGLAHTDAQGIVRGWNPALEELTLYAMEDVVGRALWDVRWSLVPEELRAKEDREAILSHYQELLAGNVQRNGRLVEARIRRKDGSRRSVEYRSFPFPLGQGIGIGLVVRDSSSRKEREDALRTQMQIYQTCFDAAGSGALVIEADTTISLVNEGFCRITGYRKEDVEWHMSWKEFVHPADLERIARYHALRRVDPASVPKEYELRVLDRKGRVHHALAFIEMLPGTSRAIASILDISDIKESAERLAITERKTRLILDSINDAFLSLDEDGSITYFNEAIERQTGRRRAEVLGHNLFKVFPEIKGTVLESIYREAIAEKTPMQREFSMQIAGGLEWFEIRVYPQNMGLSVFLEVVTDKKRMEGALQESERKFRRLVANLQEGILALDQDFNIAFANERVATMLGVPAPEMQEKGLLEVLDPRDHDWALGRMRRLSSGLPDRSEAELLRRDGSHIYVSIVETPWMDEAGKFQGTQALVSDISERKRMENALREANAKLNLLNSLTRHDLRNQLMVLRGNLMLAEKGNRSEATSAPLKKAARASENISRLLDFSRDYQGLGKDAPSWLNLAEVSTLGVASVDLGKVMVEMELDEVEVYADKMIEKAFHNLASNSVLHGKRTTRIGLRYELRGEELMVIYEDDGVGLPASLKKEIFGPSRGYHGLYLVKEVLDMTGITIEETGTEGQGARFELRVPKGGFRLLGRDDGKGAMAASPTRQMAPP